jgi:transmembrane sensor
MKPDTPTPAERPSAADCAEAAAWIAKLHGEERTAKVEAGFRRWLAASAAHRVAAEMASDVWTAAERLPKSPSPPIVRMTPASAVLTLPRALAAAALVVLVVGALYFYRSDPGIETRLGEQRSVTLDDGTRIALNTATRIHVRYDKSLRRVQLDRGEALFEVARNPQWPFVVSAGGRDVVARGTSFLVRREEHSVAVTLVEGRVTVSPHQDVSDSNSGSPDSLAPDGSSSRSASRARTFALAPGQRLTFVRSGAPQLDTPPLDKVTAWQRGQVILDHTPLADAVAEMNRYSPMQLEIQDRQAATVQVTGVFRIGDSADFAQAVAEAYHLSLIKEPRRILITGTPQR